MSLDIWLKMSLVIVNRVIPKVNRVKMNRLKQGKNSYPNNLNEMGISFSLNKDFFRTTLFYFILEITAICYLSGD
jgi:hypothetical protein